MSTTRSAGETPADLQRAVSAHHPEWPVKLVDRSAVDEQLGGPEGLRL